jgi:hypothetical protein
VGIVLAFVACGRRNFNVDADVEVDTALACDTAPVGCLDARLYVCNGKCYASCNNPLSRPAAAVACRDWGGCLGDPDSASDNDCAASMVFGRSWISPQQPSGATSPGDSWKRCNGDPVVFERWGTGHPDDDTLPEDGTQQCAAIDGGGAWDDLACANELQYVCERGI